MSSYPHPALRLSPLERAIWVQQFGAEKHGILPTESEAAMTFEQIAKELGVSKQVAYKIFARALKKLAARPWRLNAMRELAVMQRQSAERNKLVYPEW